MVRVSLSRPPASSWLFVVILVAESLWRGLHPSIAALRCSIARPFHRIELCTMQYFRISGRIRVSTIAVLIFPFLLSGCHHAIKPPVLAVAACPANSVEMPKVKHCFDPPNCTQSESWDGQLCMAIDPQTKKPLGLFFKSHCNPYFSTDCDDPDEGQAKHKGKKKKDDDD
jgi:hypothetical protein